MLRSYYTFIILEYYEDTKRSQYIHNISLDEYRIMYLYCIIVQVGPTCKRRLFEIQKITYMHWLDALRMSVHVHT